MPLFHCTTNRMFPPQLRRRRNLLFICPWLQRNDSQGKKSKEKEMGEQRKVKIYDHSIFILNKFIYFWCGLRKFIDSWAMVQYIDLGRQTREINQVVEWGWSGETETQRNLHSPNQRQSELMYKTTKEQRRHLKKIVILTQLFYFKAVKVSSWETWYYANGLEE
jgi:hypothetical protein